MTCFLIVEVKIQENAHLDLHAASKLHKNYIAVDLRHMQCVNLPTSVIQF